MGKRSITNEEIALIKAMRNRGMRNSAIQFYFNRPDRQVNSGRITNIADGSYSDSASIAVADDTTLDTFLTGFQQGLITLSAVPAPTVPILPPAPPGPLHPETIAALFKADQDGTWRFCPGETDEHECKASFRLRNPSAWLRAVASLANNRGGYILFGVHDKDVTQTDAIDKSFTVIGLNTAEFVNLDPAALHRSCVRPLVWLAGATGRYAVRTMQVTSVQRAWFAQAPGLVSRIVNIEVLCRIMSVDLLAGTEVPNAMAMLPITPNGNSLRASS